MHRSVMGLSCVCLLAAGCSVQRYSPAASVPSARTVSSAAPPTSCADALREEPPKEPVPEGLTPNRDKEDIRRVILSHRSEIENCYAASWKEGMQGGKVAVRFAIAKEGDVCAQQIRESTLHHASLEACLLKAVASWRFPASPSRTVVTYPYFFKPAPSPEGGGAPAKGEG